MRVNWHIMAGCAVAVHRCIVCTGSLHWYIRVVSRAVVYYLSKEIEFSWTRGKAEAGIWTVARAFQCKK